MPRIQLVRPHPAQQLILDEARRWNVVALGRRAGKSTLALHLLADVALHAQPAGYFAPTYKLLAEFWRELRTILEPVTRVKSEQDHRLELITGGTLECWSLDDPNPARGRKYAKIVVDEAAMVRDLLEIWQLALRPTLTDLGGGAWFMSTPRGLNDFWSLYQQGQDPLQTEWASWQMPTSVNPFIATAELVSAQHELPERAWAQEYRAEFLEIEGAGVFRGVDAASMLTPTPPEKYHQYVFGVDWARDQDFTVISVVDVSTRQQVAVDRFNKIDWEFQTERLHRWAKAYSPRLIVAEANSMGGPIVSKLQNGYLLLTGEFRQALPVQAWTATNATKASVIQALSLALEQGEISLLDDAVQKAELQAFESSMTASGLVRYAAPNGMHDDTVIALALAWSGAATEAVTSRSSYGFSPTLSRWR